MLHVFVLLFFLMLWILNCIHLKLVEAWYLLWTRHQVQVSVIFLGLVYNMIMMRNTCYTLCRTGTTHYPIIISVVSLSASMLLSISALTCKDSALMQWSHNSRNCFIFVFLVKFGIFLIFLVSLIPFKCFCHDFFLSTSCKFVNVHVPKFKDGVYIYSLSKDLYVLIYMHVHHHIFWYLFWDLCHFMRIL